MERISKRLSLGLSLAVLLSLIAVVAPVAGRSEPNVDFTADPTSGYAPLVVQFDDVSDWPIKASFLSIDSVFGSPNTPCRFEQTWDFGDGDTDSRQTDIEDIDQFDVAHTYTEPGRYTVSLTYEEVCSQSTNAESFLPTSFWNLTGSQNQIDVQTRTKELYIRVLEPKKDRPLEPAKMSVAYLNIDPMQVLPNQEVVVSANVCNQGEEDGTKTATLMVNGNAEQSQTVGVSGGACKQVVFKTSQPIPGTYQVAIDGMTGQFSVLATRTVTNNVPSQQTTGLGTAGILAIVAVGIVLIIALVVIFKKE